MVSMTLNHNTSNLFKPLAKAFILAYLSTTGPKLLSLLLSISRKKRRLIDVIAELRGILRHALQLNKFPAFCALLIGGSTLLQRPLYGAIRSISQKCRLDGKGSSVETYRLLAKFVAALLAASFSFQLINSDVTKSIPFSKSHNDHHDETATASAEVADEASNRLGNLPSGLPAYLAKARFERPSTIVMGVPLAGKTMAMTLFVFVRAVDVFVLSSPSLTAPSSRVTKWMSKLATPLLFAASSATIMHAFFYAPSRLPRTYVKWIDRIAECDERLILALREVRYGNFMYGRETGMGPLLGSMCKDLGLPEEWGDPTISIPIRCEIVHHGSGSSCEFHALSRFWRAWKRALWVYAPIQVPILIRLLRHKPESPVAAVLKVIIDAARSSAFLGAFVSFFYYGVCLGRTRLGPLIFDSKTITPQMWDGGLCTLVGCFMCGWSILFEAARRRIELVLFVLPRALGVWFPRRYPRQYRWREHVTFSISAAVVLTAAQHRPERVRGVFGKLLQAVVPQ